VDVVLTGVQPDEIALNRRAGAVSDSRIAASVEALFGEHYGRIAGMLARLTGDRARAEEIAADVFHKLAQRRRWWGAAKILPPGSIAWPPMRVSTRCAPIRGGANGKRQLTGRDSRLGGASALDAMLAEERRESVRAVLGALKPREASCCCCARAAWRIANSRPRWASNPARSGRCWRGGSGIRAQVRARYGENV